MKRGLGAAGAGRSNATDDAFADAAADDADAAGAADEHALPPLGTSERALAAALARNVYKT